MGTGMASRPQQWLRMLSTASSSRAMPPLSLPPFTSISPFHASHASRSCGHSGGYGAPPLVYCPLVAQFLLEQLIESHEYPELSQRGFTMTRFLLSIILGMIAGLGLLLPLPPGEAAVVAKTLMQTPVTGRL